MKLLEVKNLKVYYTLRNEILKALDGVSFEISKGEYLGVVGESGCGKSTIAKSIIRLLPANGKIMEGQIFFDGHDIIPMKDEEIRNIRWKEIALIVQNAMNALSPVHKISDQILDVFRSHKKNEGNNLQKRIEDLFLMVGIEKNRINGYPHQFSGGMKQRTIIAMALALNPKLIIADEPTSALDVITQNRILRELKKVFESNQSSLMMITHDIATVANICDRILIIYAGKIVEYGRISSIFRNPCHPYTMGLKNAFANLRGEKRDLISIPGSPPNLINLSDGCHFYDRCPFRFETCSKYEPILLEIEEDHFVSCHREDVDKMKSLARKKETWCQEMIM